MTKTTASLAEQRQAINSGHIYNALSKELKALRKRAKALCHEYNHTHPDNKGKRQQTLSKLLAKANKPIIESNFQCDYGDNIFIGKQFYANHNCTILDAAKVTIADNVMLGPNVTIATSGHPLEATSRQQGLEKSAPITIEDNVWIGANCCILGGVTIGKNSVVAAGSVVTKDVHQNCLVAGVPAKLLKKINNDQ